MATKIGNLFSGKISPFDINIAFGYKGKQAFRSRPSHKTLIQSIATKNTQTFFLRMNNDWFKLFTQADRDGWETTAIRINNNASLFTKQAKQVIPVASGPYSGFNAHLGSAVKSFSRAIAPNFNRPPDPTFIFPEPPRNVAVSVASGVATVTWLDPEIAFIPTGSTIVVAIWVAIQGKIKVHPQIVGILPVPSSQTFNISFVRLGHSRTGYFIPLSKFIDGELRVQMDTVYTKKISEPGAQAGLWSAGSNVATAIIV